MVTTILDICTYSALGQHAQYCDVI